MGTRWMRLARALGIGGRVRHSQVDRGPTEILARVAHEARQPLSAVRAAFEVFRKAPDDVRRERAGAVIERQLTQLTRLLDDLLEGSRVCLGLMTLQREQLDLCHLVTELVDSVSPQAEGKGQYLDTHLPAGPVWIDADSTRLQEVVSNLLVNGIRYTNPGGRVSVTLTHGSREAVLKVSDTGRGISADLLPHLFEPFTRGETAAEGLGMGLAIARQIVELHRGTIQAASAGPGKGSEFIVTLPIHITRRARGNKTSIVVLPTAPPPRAPKHYQEPPSWVSRPAAAPDYRGSNV